MGLRLAARFILSVLLILGCGAASCRPVPEDPSESAARAGHATAVLGVDYPPPSDDGGAVLGGCRSDLERGWKECLLERGAPVPKLQILFTNPGEWAVGDCNLQMLASGSAKAGEMATVDLSGIQTELDARGFCVLKIDAVEYYKDQHDSSQSHAVNLYGGMFLQSVEKGYLPDPAPMQVAWCYQVERTSKGRTTVKGCK